MKLVGMMPVRNEAWCLGLTLRAALMWCDEMVVWLHACTDDSKRIVQDIAKETQRVKELWCATLKWDEMAHRQHMLMHAQSMGATHLALIDADEILTGNLVGSVRPYIERLALSGSLQVPGYYLRGDSVTQYHSNGVWGNRIVSLAFRNEAALHYNVKEQFHHTHPFGVEFRPYRPLKLDEGGRMHLWGVTERRLRARHALYKVTERLRWPTKPTQDIELMYNDWRSPEDNVKHWPHMKDWGKPWTFTDTPRAWWEAYEPLMQYLQVDTTPWQIAEIQRLVAQHGADTFKNLDLFGIV